MQIARSRRFVGLLILGVLMAFLMAACGPGGESPPSATKQRAEQVEAQVNTIERAQAAYPIPQPTNFPTRRSLVRWMEAQDCDICPAYTYLFNDTLAEPLFYFVFENRPVSTCTFLTSPEQLIRGDLGNYMGDIVVQAPALDGVYYGGGGQCDQQFGFEAASGAMIEFNGALAVTSNQPLAFESKPIRVVGILPEAPADE